MYIHSFGINMRGTPCMFQNFTKVMFLYVFRIGVICFLHAVEQRDLPCRWGSGALHCKPGVGKREVALYEEIVNEERKYIAIVIAIFPYYLGKKFPYNVEKMLLSCFKLIKIYKLKKQIKDICLLFNSRLCRAFEPYLLGLEMHLK